MGNAFACSMGGTRLGRRRKHRRRRKRRRTMRKITIIITITPITTAITMRMVSHKSTHPNISFHHHIIPPFFSCFIKYSLPPFSILIYAVLATAFGIFHINLLSIPFINNQSLFIVHCSSFINITHRLYYTWTFPHRLNAWLSLSLPRWYNSFSHIDTKQLSSLLISSLPSCSSIHLKTCFFSPYHIINYDHFYEYSHTIHIENPGHPKKRVVAHI